MVQIVESELENFAMDIAEYKVRRSAVSEAEAALEDIKAKVKAYMASNNLDKVEVGDDVVKLIDVTKETLDTQGAKLVIPKKYLPDLLRVSTYTQLRVDRKRE